MNIFYLNENPDLCAKEHLDKHSSKMCVEYAQILSTAHRVLDGHIWFGRSTNGRKVARYFHPNSIMNQELYKAAHINHPSTKWARESLANYCWLYDLWIALCKEYEHRYERVHESYRKLEMPLMLTPDNIPDEPFTQPPPAMKEYPQCIVEGDSIASYRNYYWEAKRPFARWTKRTKPVWWIERENAENVG